MATGMLRVDNEAHPPCCYELATDYWKGGDVTGWAGRAGSRSGGDPLQVLRSHHSGRTESPDKAPARNRTDISLCSLPSRIRASCLLRMDRLLSLATWDPS